LRRLQIKELSAEPIMNGEPRIDSIPSDEPGPDRRRPRLLSKFIRSASTAALARCGHLLGELAYRTDRRHRIIVQRNLKFAFPAWEEDRIAEASRRVFRNMGRTLTELIQSTQMSRSEILARCRLKGEEHFHRALEEGRGIILVSAHLGNWEMGLQYLSCHFGKRVHLVVRPLVPRRLDIWVNRARTRFGNHLIRKRKAFPKMLKAIREDGIVALMADLSSRKQSVPVDYFGRRARTSPAAALLAARCRAPILAAFTTRNPDGSFLIEVPPPVALQRSGNLKDDLKRNTQRITDIVEKAVRAHPDQYLWMQKRWKEYYPHLYPGYRPRSTPIED
jgi:KDO2-lipid IV(A) lauroyltransferase